MSYTPPPYNATDASWQGAASYAPPSAGATNAAWSVAAVSGVLSAGSPLGAPALVGSATQTVGGALVAAGPLGSIAVLGKTVVAGRVAVSSPLGAAAVVGICVTLGRVAVASPLAAPSLVGTVHRYELRGEVRDQGVLVNRRVRAYRRSDGSLVTEADTAAGRFSLPVGFASAEYYVVPINLDPAATDYAPPCANRVTSVLAMDVAA